MIRYSMLLVFLLLPTGCGSNVDTDYQSRLNAATQINNVNDRNRALADVAVNAAKAGEGEIVKKAISAITVADKKMRAARDSAEALADAGQGEAAVEVANMITQPTMRDDTLKKIAQ